jgi:hypothetical protein
MQELNNQNRVNIDKNQKTMHNNIMIFSTSFLAVLVLIVGVLGLFIFSVIWGGPAQITSDVSDYGKFEDFKGYSNLEIFPKDLPESINIENYYYFYQDTLFDATYQIFVEYTLSEEDYQAEVQRLSQIGEQNGGEAHRIVYDTQNFNYPAYVTVFGNNLTYEYALLIEDQNKIVCVFTQFANRKDIGFDPAYLPDGFQSPGDPQVNTLGGYNIYYFQLDENAAYMERREWNQE